MLVGRLYSPFGLVYFQGRTVKLPGGILCAITRCYSGMWTPGFTLVENSTYECCCSVWAIWGSLHFCCFKAASCSGHIFDTKMEFQLKERKLLTNDSFHLRKAYVCEDVRVLLATGKYADGCSDSGRLDVHITNMAANSEVSGYCEKEQNVALKELGVDRLHFSNMLLSFITILDRNGAQQFDIQSCFQINFWMSKKSFEPIGLSSCRNLMLPSQEQLATKIFGEFLACTSHRDGLGMLFSFLMCANYCNPVNTSTSKPHRRHEQMQWGRSKSKAGIGICSHVSLCCCSVSLAQGQFAGWAGDGKVDWKGWSELSPLHCNYML